MGPTVFYITAALSVIFALLVITARNPVHSVLYLIVTFFTFTVHYVLLNAQFLAVVNFIVYMGAILVLFLFVLMLLNLNVATEPAKPTYLKIIAVVAGCCLAVTIVGALKAHTLTAGITGTNTSIGLVQSLGKVLFGKFLLPFELSSLLLLSAMVGAVLLAKKDEAEQIL